MTSFLRETLVRFQLFQGFCKSFVKAKKPQTPTTIFTLGVGGAVVSLFFPYAHLSTQYLVLLGGIGVLLLFVGPTGLVLWFHPKYISCGRVVFIAESTGTLYGQAFKRLLPPSFFTPSSPFLTLCFLDVFAQTPYAQNVLRYLKSAHRRHKKAAQTLDLLTATHQLHVRIWIQPSWWTKTVVWHFGVISFVPLAPYGLDPHAWRHIVQIYPLPLVVFSAQHTIVFVNKYLCQWLERPPEEFLNKSLDVLFPNTLLWVKSQGQTIDVKSKEFYKKGLIDGVVWFEGSGVFFVGLKKIKTVSCALNKKLRDLPLPALIIDDNGYIRHINHFFQTLFSQKKWHESHIAQWVQGSEYKKINHFLKNIQNNLPVHQPFAVAFGPEKKPMNLYGCYSPGSFSCFIVLLQPITEKNMSENQTLEVQKLQALGQLTSGIIHDFNNLLTAVLGFCDLLLQRYTPQDQSFADIMHIKQNAKRATNLVKQLLLFVRQSGPEACAVDVKDCLNNLSFLLRRLIGAKVNLHIKHHDSVGTVFVDQGQLEQIVLNLVINARDAMPQGGDLSISTQSVCFDTPHKVHRTVLAPQTYCCIAVKDTGCGIEAELLMHIFDAFFSTKTPAQGTGLGLSNVCHILQGIEGGIDVTTQIKEGTTFFVYIPQHNPLHPPFQAQARSIGTAPTPGRPPPLLTASCSGKKILLVEDEDPVRLFATRALKSKGYQVYEAREGKRALEILESHKIDLLITDVIMPGIDGPSLVNHTHAFDPHLKIIFVSGYPLEDVQSQIHFPTKQLHFLPKPFSLNQLAEKALHALEPV